MARQRTTPTVPIATEDRRGAPRCLYRASGKTRYATRWSDAARAELKSVRSELTRRLEEMRRSGGAPDSVIRQDMLEDMERDLREMAGKHDGAEARAKELLEALVIAREADVRACDEIELELARQLVRTA